MVPQFHVDFMIKYLLFTKGHNFVREMTNSLTFACVSSFIRTLSSTKHSVGVSSKDYNSTLEDLDEVKGNGSESFNMDYNRIHTDDYVFYEDLYHALSFY